MDANHKSDRGPDVSWRKLVKLLEEDSSKQQIAGAQPECDM